MFNTLLKRPLVLIASLLACSLFLIHLTHHDAWLLPDKSALSLPHELALKRSGMYWGDVRRLTLSHDGTSRFVVDLHGAQRDGQWVPMDGRVVVSVRGTDPHWRGVGHLFFRTHLRESRLFDNPGRLDGRLVAHARGIDAYGFVADPRWVWWQEGEGAWLSSKMERWRERVREAVAYAPARDRALLTSLAIGQSGESDRELSGLFRDAGVSHVLVVSGLHVGLVAVILFGCWRFLFSWSRWLLVRGWVLRWAAGGTILSLWVYVVLAGNHVSAVRAGIMATALLMAPLVGRRGDSLSALSLAATIILMINPFSLFDPSFQLSFVAVLGVVSVSSLLGQPARDDRWWWRVIHYGRSMIIATVAATIWMTPIVLYYFSTTSWVGLLANLLVIPIVSIILVPLALAITLIAPCSVSVATMISWPAVVMGDGLIQSVAVLARWGSLLSIHAVPHLWDMGIYYVTLVIALVVGRHWRWRVVVGGLCVLMVVVGLRMRWPSDRLEFTFLDIGQGSSVVVRFPNRQVMVVDGGGIPGSEFDIGERVVAPYLWHEGIWKTDWLVATHPDADHYGGLSYLADHFSPTTIWTNGEEPPRDDEANADWYAWMDHAEKSGAHLETVCESASPIMVGEVAIDVMAPPCHDRSGWSDNDQSIALAFHYRDMRVVIAGDLESKGEAWVLRHHPDLHADLIAASHHGSRSSTSELWLGHLQPKVAVIQSGKDNRFGHPHRETLERLARHDVDVFRTDHDGAVRFVLDSEGWHHALLK